MNRGARHEANAAASRAIDAQVARAVPCAECGRIGGHYAGCSTPEESKPRTSVPGALYSPEWWAAFNRGEAS